MAKRRKNKGFKGFGGNYSPNSSKRDHLRQQSNQENLIDLTSPRCTCKTFQIRATEAICRIHITLIGEVPTRIQAKKLVTTFKEALDQAHETGADFLTLEWLDFGYLVTHDWYTSGADIRKAREGVFLSPLNNRAVVALLGNGGAA